MNASTLDLLRKRVTEQPGDDQAWHALAIHAFEAGQWRDAVSNLETAIAARPDQGLYYRDLAEICRRTGDLPKAIAMGRRATSLMPDDVGAHLNFGLACFEAHDDTQAVEAFTRALEVDPNQAAAWNNLGAVRERRGDAQGALAAYQQAAALDPGNAQALNNAGALHVAAGDHAEARRAFEAALTASPGFAEAHYNLSSLKHYNRNDPHIPILEAMRARRAELPIGSRVRLCFALGKALEDIGRYDEAFFAYAEGNAIHRATLSGAVEQEQETRVLLDAMVGVFDVPYFARHQAAAHDTRKTHNGPVPIFIVGMPRSGTTLLEQMLASHPDVYGAGELNALTDAIAQATGSAGTLQPSALAQLGDEGLARIGRLYLENIQRIAPGRAFVVDKMPANFFFVGLIRLALPQAKIIHASRDALDTCFSCFARLFADRMDYTYDLRSLGRYYRGYERVMTHWRSVLPTDAFLDVPYEHVVEHTKAQAERMLDYIGLPWHDGVLSFHENTRTVKTASAAQVREPIYTRSIHRWKQFARHLGPLIEIVKGNADDSLPTADGKAQVAQALTELAQRYVDEGMGRDAEILLRDVISSFPNDAYAVHLLGVALYQTQRVDEGMALVERAVELAPGTPLFRSNLAEMYRRKGQFDMAIHHGSAAVELDPHSASARSNLGIALFDAHRLDEAETQHRRALGLDVQLAQSMNNLGSIARERGELDQAVEWYRKAVETQPDYAEAVSNLGGALVEQDTLEQAEPVIDKALSLNPRHAEAWYNLGLLRFKQARLEEASKHVQRALEIAPAYTKALIAYGRIAREQGLIDNAYAILQAAVRRDATNAAAWTQLGEVCVELEHITEAENAFGEALRLDPDSGDALTALCNLHVEHGRIDQAVDALERFLASHPDHLGARLALIQARKVTPGDSNVATLEAMLSDESNPEQRLAIHYALGKAYDDMRVWDTAFPHYLEGARIKRSRLTYDSQQERAHVDHIMQVVSQGFIDRFRGEGDPSRAPVFVLGMPRSGTTLTEQILASHPDVHGAGELRDLMDVFQQPIASAGTQLRFPDNLVHATPEDFTHKGAEYVRRLRARAPNALRMTDKMPANYMLLGLIPLVLPNAKIIHVRRNPVDTCLSCFTRLFTRHQDATYDLRELGLHYVNYARLMDHWRAVLPQGSFIEVQYEDLVADIETQARRLIDYVELPWNDACLDFHKTQRAIRTASVTQVRQPIYSSSVERWKHYERYLGPLLEALGDYVKA
ncbi:putative Tfp pilus assembly protein PilF [Pararobbsia alpina]|uniref:sulfotransferase n=1 Tax=Pararobbsia alpina TaxID=621374 RepID=UPI0039A40088